MHGSQWSQIKDSIKPPQLVYISQTAVHFYTFNGNLLLISIDFYKLKNVKTVVMLLLKQENPIASKLICFRFMRILLALDTDDDLNYLGYNQGNQLLLLY